MPGGVKILIVAPYVPYPPTSGGRIRVWAEIRHLSRRHAVSLAALAMPDEREAPAALIAACRTVKLVRAGGLRRVGEGAERLPAPVFHFFAPLLEDVLRRFAAESFDVVIFEQLFMAQYAPLFPESLAVLAEHNIESQIYRQLSQLARQDETVAGATAAWVHRATALQLEAYENRMWPRFPLRIVVSEDDRADMQRRCAAGRVVVVENGVDLDIRQPLPLQPSRTILFLGVLDYPPNVDAVLYLAERVLPLLWEQGEDVSLLVAGRRPLASVLAIACPPRIRVIADPEDIAAVAAECAMMVVPLRAGGGTRLKIPEAMALGLPVVSTRLGAHGLHVTDGRDLLLRDEPEALAAAIKQVLDDRNLRDRLRAGGLELVRRCYDWSRLLDPLESALCSELGAA